jgi:hypothetical protein
VREQALAKSLRQLAEPQRFDFIKEYLAFDSIIGLEFATKCLRNKEYFEAILRTGLRVADASSVRFWLKASIPRLGPRRVLRIIENVWKDEPKAVRKAWYWSSRLLRRADPRLSAALEDFEQRMGPALDGGPK